MCFKRLGIKIDEICRKRAGFNGAIHFIPGLLKAEYKFRSIDMKTVKMIIEQARGYGRVTEPGEWLGDIIGVSDSKPEGYLLLKKLYVNW